MEQTFFPASQRFNTKLDWLDAKHCFSFGNHYDPNNTGFGLMVVMNEDVIEPGKGFGTHSHNDMEIVTWVLSGSLEHKDSYGNHGIITPGKAQRMSAGSGISHSEFNASDTDPCHLLQMWVLPDAKDYEPSYQEIDISDKLNAGGLVKVVGAGNPDEMIQVNQPDAEMFVANLGDGDSAELENCSMMHVFVSNGSCKVSSQKLEHGDSLRISGAEGISVESTSQSTQVVVWAFHT